MLTTGSVLKIPALPGSWSVWSGAAEAPGGHFVVPADEAASATGIKYAVVRVIELRTEIRPTVALIRTDPPQETA